MQVATEVATPRQAEVALKYGIDILWIGARTTVSPIMIQEIAEVLRGGGYSCDAQKSGMS